MVDVKVEGQDVYVTGSGKDRIDKFMKDYLSAKDGDTMKIVAASGVNMETKETVPGIGIVMPGDRHHGLTLGEVLVLIGILEETRKEHPKHSDGAGIDCLIDALKIAHAAISGRWEEKNDADVEKAKH